MGRMSNEERKRRESVSANNQYKRDNYDRIALLVPKGGKEKLKEAAKRNDMRSVNALIVTAIEHTYGIRFDENDR